MGVTICMQICQLSLLGLKLLSDFPHILWGQLTSWMQFTRCLRLWPRLLSQSYLWSLSFYSPRTTRFCFGQAYPKSVQSLSKVAPFINCIFSWRATPIPQTPLRLTPVLWFRFLAKDHCCGKDFSEHPFSLSSRLDFHSSWIFLA